MDYRSIDGTVNYIHGIPLFSISIALEYDGEIIIGIINNPITNEIFMLLKMKERFKWREYKSIRS